MEIGQRSVDTQANKYRHNFSNIPVQRKGNTRPKQQIIVEGPRGCITGRVANEIRYCCIVWHLILNRTGRTDLKWTPYQVQLIDIIGTEAATSKLCPASKSRIQKLCCGWLPVNSCQSASTMFYVLPCKSCIGDCGPLVSVYTHCIMTSCS